MTSAIVLAAGYGTRLRPLTEELPKALVPVGDQPLLMHVARRLHAAGVVRAWVNAHHLSEEFSSISKGYEPAFTVLHEPRILGTAGGIAAAFKASEGAAPFIVWNGDIFVEPPLSRLLDAASKGGAVFCVAPASSDQVGSVGLDATGSIVRLRGRVFGEETQSAEYIGVAALGLSALQAVPAEGCLIGDYAIPALERGEVLGTVLHTGTWWDVGSPSGYLAANLAWLGARESWVHPTAWVAGGVTVKSSLIGEHATVRGHGVLKDCVVWPGAVAQAPARRTVFTPKGQRLEVL